MARGRRLHGLDGLRARDAALARGPPRLRAHARGRDGRARGGDPRRRHRVHEGTPGRGRHRRDPVGRGIPAAADPGDRVRRDDRRDRSPGGAPRAVDPRPARRLLRRPGGGGGDRRDRGDEGPQLRRVQVDRRVPDRAGRGRPVRLRGRRRLRSLAGGRLARDARAREARTGLPDPTRPGGRERTRPAVPLPLRRRRPRHQSPARGADRDLPPARGRPGSARRPGALGLPVGPRVRVHRLACFPTSTWSSPS